MFDRRFLNTVLCSFRLSDTIDSLFETGYITKDVARACRVAPLFINQKRHPFLYDDNARFYRASHTDCEAAAKVINAAFDAWYPTASQAARAYLTVGCLTDSDMQIMDIGDAITGFLKKDVAHPLIDSTEINDDFMVYHPSWITDSHIEAVMHRDQIVNWLTNFKAMIQRVIAVPPTSVTETQEWGLLREKEAEEISKQFYDDPFVKTGIKPKTARRYVYRSYLLASQFLGVEKTKALIRGEQIIIEATHFNWALKFDPSKLFWETIAASRVHTPFTITLFNKENRVLCNGCILWDSVPFLDQAVGFFLSTRDPTDELEFFQTMNLSHATITGKDNEFVGPRFLHYEIADFELDYRPGVVRQIDLRDVAEEFVGEVEVFDFEEREAVRAFHSEADLDSWVSLIGFDHGWAAELPQAIRDRLTELMEILPAPQSHWQTRRLDDAITDRVQNAILRRLEAPPEMIAYMMKSEPFNTWSNKEIPEVLGRYISTKAFI